MSGGAAGPRSDGEKERMSSGSKPGEHPPERKGEGGGFEPEILALCCEH